MAEKRIEIAPDAETGGVVILVRDVQERPQDVRFRVGYRYTNEWLGEDGYWRRSMTLIEPSRWRLEGSVLELWVGPEIHANIEPEQPIRVEVPGVDAGQVVLWPLTRPAASGAGDDAESAARAAPNDAAPSADEPPPMAAPKKPSSEAMDRAIDKALAATDAAVKSGANGVGAKANGARDRSESDDESAPRPARGDAVRRLRPVETSASDAPGDEDAAAKEFPGLATTTVRGSKAISLDPDRSARRRSLAKRRGHPRRRIWGGGDASDGPEIVAWRALQTDEAREGANDEADGLREGRRAFGDETATAASRGRLRGAGGAGPDQAPGTAIVPADHFNEMDDFSADEPETRPAPAPRGGGLWQTAAALAIGLVIGAGAFALQTDGRLSLGLDAPQPDRMAQLETVAAGASGSAGDDGAEVAELRSQIDTLVAALNDARADATPAGGSDAQAAGERIAALEARLDDAATARAAATADAQALRDALAASEDRLAAIESETLTLNQSLAETRTDREAARAAALAAGEERDAALSQASNLQFRIAELEAALTEVGDERNAAEAARDRAESALLEVESATTETATARQTAEGALAESEAARAEMAAEVERMRSALATAEAERQNAEAQAASIASRIAELDQGRTSLADERDAAKNAAEALAQEAQANAAALAAARTEQNRLAAALEDTEGALSRAQQAAERFAVERDQTADRAAAAVAEAQRLAGALSDMEAARDRAVREIEAARTETATLQARAAEMAGVEAENDQLRRALASAEEVARAAASAPSAASTEAALAEARGAAQRAERALDRVSMERDRALAQLSSLQRRIDQSAAAPALGESAQIAATATERRPSLEAAVDRAFEDASDLLPTRSIQRSKLRMRLIEGAPIMDAVRGELGLRYAEFDRLVDSLCVSLPQQCR